MADLNTTITVKADSSGVAAGLEPGKRFIKELGGVASATGKEVGKIGDGSDAAASKIERDTRRISNEFKRLQVAAETAGKSLSESMVIKANAYGIPLASIQAQIDGAKAFERAQLASNQALLSGSGALKSVAMSAAATSAALRNVPAQFTDIVTSLQGGQKPLTVLLQQGGQLKDMFGGAGNAAKALGGYVLGLVNPYTVAAAAAGGLFLAYTKGAAEGEAYNKALIMTGNSAGTTAAQLSVMAQAVSKATGGTVGAAADALAQLAGSGNIASAQFEKMASTAVMMEKTTGAAVADTVKQFAELGKAPLKASIDLNESTHFLTLSVYEQIKALTEQGRVLEAGVVAQNAYHDVMKARAPELIKNLGYAESAWNGVAGAAKKAWDTMLNAGRETSPGEKIYSELKAAKDRLALMQDPNYRETQNFGQAQAPTMVAIDKQQTIVNNLNEQVKLMEKSAALQAKGTESIKAQIEFDKEHDKYLSKSVQMNREIAAAAEKFSAVDQTPANLAKYAESIKGIQDKFKESAAPKVSTAGESELAGIRARNIETQKYIDTLRAGGIEGAKQNEGEKLSIKIKEELLTSISGVARANKVASLAEAEKLAALLKVSAAEENHQKAIKKSADEYQNLIDATYKGADSIAEQAARQEAANAVFGKGKAAIEAMTLAELNHQMAEAQGSDQFSDQYIAGLQAKIDAQMRYAKSLDAADYKTVNAHTQELLRSAKEMDSLYRSEAEYAYTTGVEREKIIAMREVEIKFAKELAKIEASNMSDAEKAAQRQVVNQAKQIEGSAAVSKVMQSDWSKTVEKYDDIFRTGFADMLNNGKGAWESFSKSLVTTFKTSVADQLYKMFAQPFIMKIIASLIGVTGSAAATAANAAGAAGSGSSALGTASNAYSAYGTLAGGAAAFGSAFSAGAAIGMEAFSAGATMMAEATGISSFMAGAGQMLGAIGPAGWAALAVVAAFTLFGGNSDKPTASTGDARVSFDATGAATARSVSSDYHWGGNMSKEADDFAVKLNTSYLDAAKSLGIKAAATQFDYSGNTGKNGEHPNFAIAGGVVGKEWYSTGGETTYSEAALNLAASRVIFNALQKSELPKYLQGAFDGLTASEMTQDQINKTMAAAQSVKTFHDQLQLLPFESLKDLSFKASAGLAAAAGGLSNLGSMLGTYYDKFYSSDEKTALMTKNTSKAFADLGLVMPAIGTSTRAAYRAMIEELAARDMSVEANAKAYAGALALAGAIDQLAPALEDASTAAKTAAATAMASVKAALDVAKNNASAAYSTLERAVSAQRASYELTASIASEQVSAIGSVFGVLKSNVQSLYSQVASSSAMQAAQGNAFIDQALSAAQSTGYLPDSAALTDAISAARAGAEGAVYASQQDADFARLVLAGKLSQMEAISGTQLTEAQKSLKLAQDQISGLDEILKVSKAQLDAASGIDTSILSVADAVKLVNDSIKTLINAQAITEDATRMESISSYIKSIYDNSSATAEAGSLGKISDTALKYDVSMSDVARSMKLSLESVQALYKKFGVEWKSSIGTEWIPSTAATAKPTSAAPSSSGVVSVGGGGGAKAASYYDAPGYYTEYALSGYGTVFNAVTDAAAISRLDGIQAHVRALSWGEAETNKASAAELAKKAIEEGFTQRELASSMHLPYADVVALFDSANVQRFATGGVFSNGIVSRPTNFDMGQMGEKTPEAIMPLVNIGGSLGVRAVGGGGRTDTSRLEALLEAVQAELVRLNEKSVISNGHAERTAKAVNGQPDRPVLVEIA